MDIQKEHHPDVDKKVAQVQDTKTHKVWIGTYIALAAICLVVYFLVKFRVFALPVSYTNTISKLSLAALSALPCWP